MKGWIQNRVWLPAMALAVFAVAGAAQTVPSVVVSSPTTVYNSGVSSPGKVVQDTCGNLYEMEAGGNLIEIPANGGPSVTIGSYGSTSAGDGLVGALAIDSQNNLYVDNKWSGQATEIPSTNCVPNPGAGFGVLGNGSIGPIDGWWYDPGDIAVDGAGDMFVVSDGFGGSGSIYEQTSSGAGVLVMGGNSIPQVQTIAVDASGDIFFTTSGSGIVYEIPKASYGTNSPTPVITSGIQTAFGLAFDPQGNLLIGDSSTGSIYEVPFTTSLQFGSMYLVASGLPLSNPLSLGQDGKTILYTNGASSNIYEQVRGGSNFGGVAVGSTAKAILNVAFNAAVQPATIAFSSSSAFANLTGGTCVAGTSYTAGTSCTIAAQFAPATPGVASGGIVLANSAGSALATAYLQGTGQGAGLTLDSGTITSVGGGFTTPVSVALDGAGNSYFADAGANAVLEFTPGSTKPISLGSGLSKPAGVAVDGAGDVIVADTGNNQVVEIPVVNGKLSSAAQLTLISSSTSIDGSKLSGPAGVTIDASGNLYIADTGNNRIVYLPYNGGWNLSLASALGSNLTAPLATAVDPRGNLFVADSGSGQIYKLAWPLSSGIQQLVAVGYSNPSALATDASGSLFVVNQGAGSILRIPNLSGSLDPNDAIQVGIGSANPYGLAVDQSGNLYVADSTAAAAYLITRTTTTEAFGDWAVSSSSGALPVKVENAGNESLILSAPYYTASGNTGDFSLSPSPSNECANGGTVAVGDGCELDATFTPTASGSRSETLVLSSNAVNAASAQVTLTGNGETTAMTATSLAITTPASGNPYFGEPITLTASVTASSGTVAGSAQLLVDGAVVGQSTLTSGGVATFTLATGLTGGTHSLQAVYLGSSTFDGSYSTSLSVAVTTAPTTSTLVTAVPYINPNSAVTGTSVTFTVTVNSTGVGIPTGSVSFATGSTSLGTVSVAPAAGGAFQASITTTALPVGTDLVTATYSGDANYVSSSASGTVVVVAAPAFAIAASGTTLTSSKSSDGSITFSSTSYGGWQGVINYQCLASSLPANAICVFSPGQVNVLASTSTTPYPVATTQLKVVVDNPPNSPAQSSMLWWVGGFTGFLLFWMRRRMMRGAWATMTTFAGIALLAIAASGLSACSDNMKYITPTGTSTVTVIASADPFASGSTSTVSACGTSSAGVESPALSPCSQQTFKVSLTVQ